MNVISRSAIRTTALACAVLPIIALAGGAQAQGLHVKVGDLSQAPQAAAFDRNLEAAARRLCTVSPDGVRRYAYIAECKNVVRAEALSQLRPAQRDQLTAFDRVQLAGAGR